MILWFDKQEVILGTKPFHSRIYKKDKIVNFTYWKIKFFLTVILSAMFPEGFWIAKERKKLKAKENEQKWEQKAIEKNPELVLGSII